MIQRTFPPSITLTSASVGTIRPRRKPAMPKRRWNSFRWSELSSALGAGLTTPPQIPRWARVSRHRPKPRAGRGSHDPAPKLRAGRGSHDPAPNP
jgi:hypothetical protein